MSTQPHRTPSNLQPEPTGCLRAVLRLGWLAVGNMALLVSAAMIARRSAPVISDIVFFALVIGLIGIRYVDITRFGGQTADGEPATLADWRRYAILLVAVSAAIWGAARFIAFRGWV